MHVKLKDMKNKTAELTNFVKFCTKIYTNPHCLADDSEWTLNTYLSVCVCVALLLPLAVNGGATDAVWRLCSTAEVHYRRSLRLLRCDSLRRRHAEKESVCDTAVTLHHAAWSQVINKLGDVGKGTRCPHWSFIWQSWQTLTTRTHHEEQKGTWWRCV